MSVRNNIGKLGQAIANANRAAAAMSTGPNSYPDIGMIVDGQTIDDGAEIYQEPIYFVVGPHQWGKRNFKVAE